MSLSPPPPPPSPSPDGAPLLPGATDVSIIYRAAFVFGLDGLARYFLVRAGLLGTLPCARLTFLRSRWLRCRFVIHLHRHHCCVFLWSGVESTDGSDLSSRCYIAAYPSSCSLSWFRLPDGSQTPGAPSSHAVLDAMLVCSLLLASRAPRPLPHIPDTGR